MKNSEVLNKQEKIIRSLCYQLICFQSAFENEFVITNNSSREIFESIIGLYKKLQNEAFALAELLNELLEFEEV